MLDLDKTYKQLDIRAEVLIAELMDRTDVFDGKRLTLSPQGDFNKSMRCDITQIILYEEELDEDHFDIQVVRNGLYDSLPLGLFHDPTSRVSGESNSSKAQRAIENIKERKNQEKAARRFFSPFDHAFNHYRLILEDEERKVLTGFPVGSRHTLFDIIWGGFGKDMSNYQKSALFSILPMAHNIAGNISNTSFAFQAILGFETKIELSQQCDQLNLDNHSHTLGNIFLSRDSILGDNSEEQELYYEIKIQHIPTTKIIDFLPEGKTRKVVKILCGFFLPAEISYTCTFDFESEILQLEESSNTDANRNRLGYGVTL